MKTKLDELIGRLECRSCRLKAASFAGVIAAPLASIPAFSGIAIAGVTIGEVASGLSGTANETLIDKLTRAAQGEQVTFAQLEIQQVRDAIANMDITGSSFAKSVDEGAEEGYAYYISSELGKRSPKNQCAFLREEKERLTEELNGASMEDALDIRGGYIGAMPSLEFNHVYKKLRLINSLIKKYCVGGGSIQINDLT